MCFNKTYRSIIYNYNFLFCIVIYDNQLILIMKKYVLILFDESQTLLLGSELARICTMGCVIYLNGYVGTGKTIFCKGFLSALGHINYIKSPTYTLVESYFLSHRYIYHIDCYRFSSVEELRYIDIRDNITKQSIFLIEWPMIQKKNILPNPDIIVTINYDNNCEQSRKIVIESVTGLGVIIVNSLFDIINFKYEIY